jgi:hypothetical protein
MRFTEDASCTPAQVDEHSSAKLAIDKSYSCRAFSFPTDATIPIGLAGRISDHLGNRYGEKNVFLDLTTIPTGARFPDTLRKSVTRADVMLLFIGPKWRSADEGAQSRIWNEADWVRLEILTALENRVPILPILIDGAKMLNAAELPENMQSIADVQAASIHPGVEFKSQMRYLSSILDERYFRGPFARFFAALKRGEQIALLMLMPLVAALIWLMITLIAKVNEVGLTRIVN